MGKVVGLLFLLVSVGLIFTFAVTGTIAAQKSHVDMGEPVGFSAPFEALGSDYPADCFIFLGGLYALLIGCALTLKGPKRPALPKTSQGEEASKTSRYARLTTTSAPKGTLSKIAFVNAILVLSFLFVAYEGAMHSADPATYSAFFGAAAIGILTGLGLLALSLLEKPKSLLPLALSTVIYLTGAVAGGLAFFKGMG